MRHSDSIEEGCGTISAAVSATLIVFVIGPLLNGWALQILWGWFVEEAFALPALSLETAMGLGLLIGFLTSRYIPSKEEDNSMVSAIKALMYVVLSPLFTVLFGYIIQLIL